ncbi:MAG: hypothetical protein RR930_03810 [Clostridium sp.]
MTRKKGKLMSFMWSLIPGAGEMYLGFFKQGSSLMTLFFVLLGVSGFLNLSFLAFLSPIVWFYSFFHTNNLNSLPDDEFYAQGDDYIIHWSDLTANKVLIQKYRKLLAGCLIFFGVSVLWSNFSRLLFGYIFPILNLSDMGERLVRFIANSIPQSVVAIAIIILGIYLIKGKYDELKQDDTEKIE